MIREPAVAGQFYPGAAAPLKRQIEQFVDKGSARVEAIGVVSPHAGYIYSGPVAGALFSRIKLKETFVIMGPNHTGSGRPFSIMTEGSWKTPLGQVEIDSQLGKEILNRCAIIQDDVRAHSFEHSIEVQLPFLQYFKEDFKFVPIALSHLDGDTYKQIGKDLAAAIKQTKKAVVIIASSDMTHYEPQATAKSKDSQAIEAILELDEDELLRRIKDLDISMCGYAPTVAMLTAAKELGAKRAELVKYQTSADTSGDYSAVVGYAGIMVLRSTSDAGSETGRTPQINQRHPLA